MIDCIFGDPEFNDWERNFIDSVARQGWQRDYSSKQKAVIKRIYVAQKNKYSMIAGN